MHIYKSQRPHSFPRFIVTIESHIDLVRKYFTFVRGIIHFIKHPCSSQRRLAGSSLEGNGSYCIYICKSAIPHWLLRFRMRDRNQGFLQYWQTVICQSSFRVLLMVAKVLVDSFIFEIGTTNTNPRGS